MLGDWCEEWRNSCVGIEDLAEGYEYKWILEGNWGERLEDFRFRGEIVELKGEIDGS